ncbi:MAG: hypothetical protein COC12_08295 [Rhodobacteraceae bacterium]|nr:MAG: hypothetical protein COC12_08295 [Paracoccaceae bacterium]
MTLIDESEWPEGWGSVDAETGALFAAQLLSETGPLSDMRVDTLVCIGRFEGSDDMVFAVEGWDAPYFVTHLSWAKPDARNWLVRWLRPWPDLAPVLVPVHTIGDLARYFE